MLPFAFHIAYSAFTAFIVIFGRLNQLETRFYQYFICNRLVTMAGSKTSEEVVGIFYLLYI